MQRTKTTAATIAIATAVAGTALVHAPAQAADGHTVFLASAVEHADHTVTLPLHRGKAATGYFWYVVIDASNSAAADRFGVNVAQKLENAPAKAVQAGKFVNGVLMVDAGVDFTPARSAAGGNPGSVGEYGYTPLVRLPDGTVLDAPQIANSAGQHDKVVSLDTDTRQVRLRETEGRARGNVVHYVSTDASDPGVAALEGATSAPRLNQAPYPGNDGTDSARASLAAFVNGQTGVDNPQRQGIASALADGLDPLNVLAWTPNQGRYSPLWDVHLAQWTPAAKKAGRDLRQSQFADVEDLAKAGLVTAPDGGRFRASKIVVVCPIVSQN
ncbi:MAG: hypothetical protein ACJ72A_24150 [Nocardioidaceae bacterium]|jgi:hypothetical protein